MWEPVKTACHSENNPAARTSSLLFLQGLIQHKQIPQNLSIKGGLTLFLQSDRNSLWSTWALSHTFVLLVMNENKPLGLDRHFDCIWL
jgi:hypothetical protein